MPTNVTAEYAEAQKKYLNAKNRAEKIAALEEMISTLPKHKGTDVLFSQLKQRLSKLKLQKEAKSARKITTIAKEGDALFCIIGFTQSGKSTLLSKLTNAKPEIASRPFTTTKPQVGVCDYKGAKIQLVEVPSTFYPSHMNIAQNADGIILVLDKEEDLMRLEQILRRFRINKPFMTVTGKEVFDIEELKTEIWRTSGLVRVYTKEPGKPPEKKPLVLKPNSTVEDAARGVHKDFLKFFRFARIWGRSAKYAGEKVGLEHILEDGDILEIHI